MSSGEKRTYTDKEIQQGQIETRGPNRIYQREDLPSGNQKACRRNASGGLQIGVGFM